MKFGTFYRGEVQPIVWLDVVLFLLAAVATVLNVVLLYLTYNRKAIDTVLMAIIACLDLVSALCVIGSSIWKWASGYAAVKDDSAWCHINAMVGWSSTFSALNVMALLSLVRYLTIVRGWQLRNRTVLLVTILLVAAITLLFGAKQIVNMPVLFTSGMYCMSVWSDGTALSSTLSILVVVVATPPIVIIPVCYAYVTSFYTTLVIESNQDFVPKKLYRQRRSLILVILCYLMTMLPEYCHAFWSVVFEKYLVSWVDGVCKNLVFAITIINPIFAVVCHAGIRDQLQDLLDPFYT